MSYPKFLLKDVYWSFAIGKIANVSDFVKEIEDYHKAASGRRFPLKWNDIALDNPTLEVQYVKYMDDEIEEPSEILIADNKKGFTVKELLFKIHQVGINLEDADNCYFEGLLYSGEEDEHGPIYFLITGT